MKYLLLLPFLLLFSCSEKDEELVLPDNELSGTWRLVEQYISTGGGGYWVSVESDLVITFNNNGSFEANWSVCGVEANNPVLSTGFYSIDKKTLTPRSCSTFLGDSVPYRISAEGNLSFSVFWGCVEACGRRYRKITD